MALLEIPYKNNFALVRRCARANIEILEYLLQKLKEAWLASKPPADGYNTLSEECLTIIEKIIDLLPRVDSIDPIPVDLIHEAVLIQIFIAKTDRETAEFLPCELINFHQFTPTKSNKKIPKIEDEITVDNVPIADSGNDEADLMGTLLCLTQGDVMSAAYIVETWDAEFIDKTLFAYNERQRDPEERKQEYMNNEFEKWKAKNEDVVRKARFGF